MIEIIPLDEPAIPAGEFDNLQAITDKNGCTPGPEQTGSLLVTERTIRAHAERGQPPVHILYTYLIRARKAQAETEIRLMSCPDIG